MPDVRIRPDLAYAWSGPSLLVVNTRGEAGDDQRVSGYYFREARYLRTLQLEIDGERPWLCEAAASEPNALSFTFIHPEIAEPSGGGTGQAGDEEQTNSRGIPERALIVGLSYQVDVSELRVSLALANHSRRTLTVDVGWQVSADFADIQETQGSRREQDADVSVASLENGLQFSYGHPQLPYGTQLLAEGPNVWHSTASRLTTTITLGPQESAALGLRVIPTLDRRAGIDAPGACQRRDTLMRWREGFARIDAPGNRLFEQTLERNVRDFASFPLLDGNADEWLALQAGMPLYPALFGRDAITAGWQASYVDRGQALGAALNRLASMQTDRVNDWRDEEPGRIPYQVRTGPLAVLNINPYAAYYADYASPLLFVIGLANLYAWSGDETLLSRHWDAARRILDWAREWGDRDGDGFLEYHTRSAKGTKNQGWKDSGDAVVYDDGTPVPAPIGTCELQGYWYLAQTLVAMLCGLRGDRDDAAAYAASARDLKARFNREWWIADESFFALAMDPDKRLVRALTSNVGQCIACGIIDTDHLRPVVGRMFAPDLFSGWGIRTLSSRHSYYNPLSYHRGSVWAVEQATIIFGLRRFGFDARAMELGKALVDLAQLYPERRIPECIGGYARGERPTPGAYPRANAPQLWNATSLALFVHTMLGLLPLAPFETLVVDPALPGWLPDLTLHDLRVGPATASLRFWRTDDGRSEWEVLRKQGTLRIVRQPPPESLTADAFDRVTGVIETVTH